jgi:exonuclease V
MASPAIETPVAIAQTDAQSDYGSDFSPEEEQIVSRLLSGHIDIEDNPITLTNVEQNEAAHSLRIPRIFGNQPKSPLFEATRAAEDVAEQISKSVKTSGYPNCERHRNPMRAKSD